VLRVEGSYDGARFLRWPEDIVRSSRSWSGLVTPVAPVGGGAWTRAWLAAYSDGYRAEVLVTGPPDAPSGVLPLVRHRRRPWVAETLGVAELAEATDALLRENAAADAIAEALVRRRMALRLRRLPADSPLVPALHRATTRRSGRILSRPVMGTPFLALDSTWLEPESHFSSKRRQDFRAARRRLGGFGEAQFTVEEPTTREDANRLLDEFAGVEAAGWKSAAGTSLAVQPRMRAFFREFCELSAAEGTLRFAVLRVDGQAAAGQLAVETDGRYSLFKIGYDERFARSSPGTLLMLHTVAWAARRELASVELLGSVEPWTAMWTTAVRPCIELHLYPMRPVGALAAASTAVRLARKSVRERRERREAPTVARTS
jgi:CelD/BcsL family acetyltransferase involved in cellulose biosynthesis